MTSKARHERFQTEAFRRLGERAHLATANDYYVMARRWERYRVRRWKVLHAATQRRVNLACAIIAPLTGLGGIAVAILAIVR